MKQRNDRAVDPASSSDDESSSSTSFQDYLREIGSTNVKRNDTSSGSDSERASVEFAANDQNNAANPVSNFDDLPTDDSDEESDTDDNDSTSDDNENKKSNFKKYGAKSDEMLNRENDEDTPLAERVASRANQGFRHHTYEEDGENFNKEGSKQQLARRKSRAISLASDLLKKSRGGKSASNVKNKLDEKLNSKTKIDNDENLASDDSSVERITTKSKADTKRKKSKHAPTEMSSKRSDYFARGRPDLNSSGIGVSIGSNRYKPRDPRMVSLSGHLDDDMFEKRYEFLDEVQDKEIDSLKQRVAAWKTSGKKGQKARKKLGMTQEGGSLEDDQEELKRLLQERSERNKAQVARAAKRTVKKKLRDEVASGKQGAYYPKRKDQRRMELEAKFEEIRKRGGDEAVDRAIAKRRKKNISKSRKLMPSHLIS